MGYVEPCKYCILLTLHKHAPGAAPGILVHRALAEENPDIARSAAGWSGKWWIDGYPMDIDASTRLISSPDSTVLHKLGVDMLSGNPLEPKYHIHTVHELRSSRLLSANTWVFYRATYKTNHNPIVSQLILWPNQTSIAEKKFLSIVCYADQPAGLQEVYSWQHPIKIRTADTYYSGLSCAAVHFTHGRNVGTAISARNVHSRPVESKFPFLFSTCICVFEEKRILVRERRNPSKSLQSDMRLAIQCPASWLLLYKFYSKSGWNHFGAGCHRSSHKESSSTVVTSVIRNHVNLTKTSLSSMAHS